MGSPLMPATVALRLVIPGSVTLLGGTPTPESSADGPVTHTGREGSQRVAPRAQRSTGLSADAIELVIVRDALRTVEDACLDGTFDQAGSLTLDALVMREELLKKRLIDRPVVEDR